MCGGAEFQEAGIYDTGIAVTDILTTGIIGGVTAGAFVTLVASVIVLKGPRRWVSVAMLAMLAMIALLLFSSILLNSPILGHLVTRRLTVALIILFAFTGFASLIHWPTNRRIVNLPVVFGAGISTFCTLALVIFV